MKFPIQKQLQRYTKQALEMDNKENENEVTVLLNDAEMESPSFHTPSTFGPACWPAAPAPILMAPAPILKPKNGEPSLPSLTPYEYHPPLTTPTGAPLRVQPLLPAIQVLDTLNESAAYEGGAEAHKEIEYPASRFFPCESPQDKARTEEALKELDKHIKQRGPYVNVVSTRLQAALRLRNELPFSLNINRWVEEYPGPNLWGQPARPYMFPCSFGADIEGVDMSLKLDVDEETGQGLLYFLLQQSKKLGYKRQVCKSISFHDFTPDIKTGAHQNVLLKYYSTEGMGTITSYEVDL